MGGFHSTEATLRLNPPLVEFILLGTSSCGISPHDLIIFTEFCMKENKLADLSMDFAVKSLIYSDKVNGHYSLKNQFERSATSIGANIREANYAQSKADFISKLQIALKECYETEYWLELFINANIMSKEETKELLHFCGELRRMLVASVNTSKNKQ